MHYRKENGLSRRFAPRNDRGGGVIANQCLAPADTRHVSAHLARHVLATADTPPPSACHCEPVHGAPQRGTLCGERSPKGALPCSGLWPELGMADFGATTWRTLGRRGVAICIPAVTQDNEQYFRQIRNRLRICPGRTLLQTLTPYKFLHVIAMKIR